jgi:hypothetical protein
LLISDAVFANAVKVGVAQFPGGAQVRPEMVEDLLEPVLAGKERGTFVVLIDVVLLEQDPVVTEAALEWVGPSDVVLGRHQRLE